MKKEIILNNNPLLITFRYIILLILVLNSFLFYKILTPITIWFSSKSLDIFYKILVLGNRIFIQDKVIEIIPACVAGSAYILLLILNLFVAMKPKQRIYSLILSMSLLLILNILRIFFLSILLINDFAFFDLTHKIFWYVLSTIFVVAIWFFTIKIFSIKQIPIVSDVKFILNSIKHK
jgi:exosortase/archaeosortase family protein